MIPLKISRLLLILFIAGTCAQDLDAQTPGVECGCDTIGPYVAPYSKAIKVEDGPSLQEGTSPGGKYTLEATPADYPNIVHLNIRCGSKSILSISSRAEGWGFSPDGDRFVMHGMTTGGQHWVMLYNLDPDPSVTGENAEMVRQTGPSFVTSASVRFSPHGKYLLYAALGNSGSLMLHIYDTKTIKEPVYSIAGGAPIVGQPSGKSIAGWGFSPDEADRTFVHAFLTGTETYALIVKNLETGEDVIRSPHSTGIASFKFSLCGDYFLWSRREGTADRHCYFYRTSETNTSADEHFSGDELISVKTDKNNHIAKFLNDNNEYTFANAANNPCDDDVPPTWPGEASLTDIYTTGTTIGLTWDAATDPAGNIRYKLLQDGSKIAEVEDTIFEVADLEPSTSFNFKVEAGDVVGNWTGDGPEVTASTETDSIPVWRQGSWLAAPEVEGVKMRLEWYGARDDWGITGYRIYRNGERIDEMDGDAYEYWVTGLQPLDVDTFRVEAGDAAGHWIAFPLELIASTKADDPPTWNGAQIYLDEATENSIAFHWDAASDVWRVNKYRISRAGTDTVVLPGHIKTYLEEDLEEGTTYTFSIAAGDEAGNWSDPLSADLMTIPSHVILPLIVASGYQGLPDIDDRLVVWNDNRNGNSDIFNYNLKTETEDDLITDPAWQGQPKSSDGRIVWTDNRNGNSDIYMYDMYDPLHRVVSLCEAAGDQLTPVIDGNIVVWSDYRSGNWDIYMLDLLTMQEKAVCTNSSSQVAPDVSGNIIVWEDARHGNPDIYGYIISTEEEFEVCRQSDEQRNPAVETKPEYRIFWQDNRNGNWDIYMRIWFVSSFEVLKVYLNYSGNQTNPDIDDEVLVFQDDKDGTWDIYAYNFYNKYYGNMEPVCLESGDQLNPRTSKGRIVWEDRRNDDGDIYIWDRPPGTDLSLALKENADPIAIGKTLVYELTARNNGPDDEDSAKVVCTLPVEAQLTDTMATAGSITKTGLELTWFIGSLPVDSSEVLRINLKTFYLATLSFRIHIEGDGFDPDPSNNRIFETSEVKLVAGEALEKGYAPSIYTGPYGTSYIVYGTDDSVALASKILQGAWNIAYLDSVNGYSDGDILKDANGDLHICYSDDDYYSAPKSRLFYMTDKNQGFWENRIIALSDSGFTCISLGINDQGPLHLLFQQSTGVAMLRPFKYMNYRSGAWSYPELFYEEGYDHIDLAMDNEGFVHAAFIALNRGIAYQKSQDTIVEEWLPDELIEPDWRGGQKEGMVVDIGVDSSGTPHVIYPGGTDGDHEENIKYARRTGGTWHYEEVDDGEFGSAATAIAVEPSGIAHLCYSHFPSRQIRYATNIAGSWIKQTLERNAQTWFSDLDMEVDGYGNVHITYLHNENVMYALRPPIEYFTIEPDTLDFGTVQVNDSKLLFLKLFNESAERILIDTVRVLDNQGYDIEFIPFT